MAKLSARGATVLGRWRGDGGKEMALTSDGRLLSKAFKGEGWKLVGRSYDRDRAGKYAALRGMVSR